MDVALVAVVAPEFENHSVAVLRGALGSAGFEHCVIPFGGFATVEQMVREVLNARPRICGVSLQTTESTLAALAFTRLLRERGYAGMIVVGGHVATLAAEEILAAPAGVDVVVELAGESALVGLARGEHPSTLAGTVTREGRGQPPVAVQPRAIVREKLSEHLGFGAADLIMSRGCAASCGYCCVAAVSDRATRAGGGRHVVREVDLIADEIAMLAKRGGRALHFMDDNVLPLDPAQAIEWTRSLQTALDARRVPPIAFSLQLRADVVTAGLAAALADLGLVRAYVGIDGYSSAQLRAIGRSSSASAGNAAIAELSARGVYCVANALLVGPTIHFETILGEIEALATVRDAPVHLLPIEARPGTVYHRRAKARGLIEGGPLWPVYKFEDERSFLLSEVITGLPTRLAERSVPIALYDLAWGLGVARRLAPAANVEAAATTYASVTAAWNADQIRILRAAAEAANSGAAAIATLLAREQAFVRAHDDALLRACDDALVEVERAVSHVVRRPVRAHARGRLLGGIALTMGLAAACHGNRQVQADAAIDAMPDAYALPACADTSRTSGWDIHDPDRGTCNCGDTNVNITFDANGVITDIVGSSSPLSDEMRQCLLDLFTTYCYPTLAGMTRTFMTCHSWIA
jgi:anaerobic magnesium-protoporphyrin IX monomethyl ester cyclase